MGELVSCARHTKIPDQFYSEETGRAISRREDPVAVGAVINLFRQNNIKALSVGRGTNYSILDQIVGADTSGDRKLSALEKLTWFRRLLKVNEDLGLKAQTETVLRIAEMACRDSSSDPTKSELEALFDKVAAGLEAKKAKINAEREENLSNSLLSAAAVLSFGVVGLIFFLS